MKVPPKKVSITVTGGTGSATIAGTQAMASGFGTQVPAGAAYAVDFTDADGYGIGGRGSLNGNTTVRDSFQVWDTLTITIISASVDGTYKVKVWFAE